MAGTRITELARTLELGVKYRFFHETDYLPGDCADFFRWSNSPPAPPAAGSGTATPRSSFPSGCKKSFGEDKKWTTYGGGGFWYTPGNDFRNFYRFGWEVQRDLSEQLTLGAEVYHETPTAVGIKGHTAFNVGGYWNFDEHQHLLFSAGRDIDGPNRFSSYLGFQLPHSDSWLTRTSIPGSFDSTSFTMLHTKRFSSASRMMRELQRHGYRISPGVHPLSAAAPARRKRLHRIRYGSGPRHDPPVLADHRQGKTGLGQRQGEGPRELFDELFVGKDE